MREPSTQLPSAVFRCVREACGDGSQESAERLMLGRAYRDPGRICLRIRDVLMWRLDLHATGSLDRNQLEPQ
ncbi:MAG: hypothetical protein C5B48_02615 [Candidatus Rokuibacteriota bacterium]|nr:MAG: hypothetical protein C5B48_02615 [Candidatus Rokubacteria bacterium]